MGRLRRPYRDALLLIALCAATYGLFLDGPFLYDDFALIGDNPHVKDLRQIGQFFTVRYWNEVHVGTRGVFRPLREVVFTLITSVFGPEPAAFHAVSFGLHVVTCLLVYLLARRLLRDDLAALLGAGLFAIHPVHLEAVLWAKNLAEILAALFVLTAFLLFVRCLQPDLTRSARAMWCAGATVAYALALLCKESGFALPGILLLYALCSRPRGERLRAVGLVAPMALLALAYLFLQFAASDLITAAVEGQRADPDEALWLRPALVGKTYAFYFLLLLLPVQLCAQYHFAFPVSYVGGEALPWLLFLGGVLAALGVAFVRWPRAAWLLAWCVAFLAPVSNLIPFKGRPVGDQRLYVPSIGFCLLFGAVAAAVWRRRWPDRRRKCVRAALGGALLLMLILLLVRGPVWTDTNRFWFDMLRKSYLQSQANQYLGETYFRAGLPLAALVHADYCVQGAQGELLPMHAQALALLGESNAALGDPAEAKKHFLRALEVVPGMPRALVGLGASHLQLREYDRAVEAFEAGIRGRFAPVHAYVGLALAHQGKGEFRKSVAPLQRAIQMAPDDPLPHRLLGAALQHLNDPEGAEREFRIARELLRRPP